MLQSFIETIPAIAKRNIAIAKSGSVSKPVGRPVYVKTRPTIAINNPIMYNAKATRFFVDMVFDNLKKP